MSSQKSKQKLWASRLSRDCVERATDPDAKCLKNKEWRVLRRDMDLSHREEFQRTFAEEEGNKDDGLFGPMEGGSCMTKYSFELDEDAERYRDSMPSLAESLFNALDVLRYRHLDGTEDADNDDEGEELSESDLEILKIKFTRLAEVFMIEHGSLELRRGSLLKELEETRANMKSIFHQLKDCHSTLQQCTKSNGDMILLSDLIQVLGTLKSIMGEYELYSGLACRNAHRMGMIDVESRVHKMLDVMILYVQIMKSKFDKLETEHKILSNESAMLSSAHNASPSHLALHYANAGLNNFLLSWCKEKRNCDCLHLVKRVTQFYEILSSDMFWPWNSEQTMHGIKQILSVLLMILGIVVFLFGIVPANMSFFSLAI